MPTVYPDSSKIEVPTPKKTMVKMTPTLRKALKIEALRRDMTMEAAIAEAVTAWLNKGA